MAATKRLKSGITLVRVDAVGFAAKWLPGVRGRYLGQTTFGATTFDRIEYTVETITVVVREDELNRACRNTSECVSESDAIAVGLVRDGSR